MSTTGEDAVVVHTEPSEAISGQSATTPRQPRWWRRRWVWIVSAVALLLLIVLVWRLIHRSSNKTAPPPPTAITVAQSRTGSMNVYVTALGTVTPVYTVSIYSQITGRVLKVQYREGQLVRQGDPLIDIDPRPYQANLMQAEGQLQHDQGLLAQAQIDLKRYQAAYAKNAIAGQQVDDQEQLVVQYQGSVKADEGTVAYDRVQLEYCHIVSPISGRVGLRLVDPGNTVFAGSGSTLLVITQLQPITVVFSVSEEQVPPVQSQLRDGNKLRVDAFDRADDHPIESGELTSLDNVIDTTTGTLRFRAQFNNQTLALFPNQFVNARLLLKTLSPVTLVPSAAVQHNGTSAFIYTVRSDSTVLVQPVTTLATDEQATAVSGIGAGVTVATSGFDRLESGAKTAVRAAAGTGSSGSGAAPVSGASSGGSGAP